MNWREVAIQLFHYIKDHMPSYDLQDVVEETTLDWEEMWSLEEAYRDWLIEEDEKEARRLLRDRYRAAAFIARMPLGHDLNTADGQHAMLLEMGAM